MKCTANTLYCLFDTLLKVLRLSLSIVHKLRRTMSPGDAGSDVLSFGDAYRGAMSRESLINAVAGVQDQRRLA